MSGGRASTQLQVIHVIERFDGDLNEELARTFHFHGELARGYVAQTLHFASEFGLLERKAGELTHERGGLEAYVVTEDAAEQVDCEAPPVK